MVNKKLNEKEHIEHEHVINGKPVNFYCSKCTKEIKDRDVFNVYSAKLFGKGSDFEGINGRCSCSTGYVKVYFDYVHSKGEEIQKLLSKLIDLLEEDDCNRYSNYNFKGYSIEVKRVK